MDIVLKTLTLSLLLVAPLTQQARGDFVTYAYSNDTACPPTGCSRDDPNNPIPLQELPLGSAFQFPKFDNSRGILTSVSVDFFFNLNFYFNGVALETGRYGWEHTATATLQSSDVGLLVSERPTQAAQGVGFTAYLAAGQQYGTDLIGRRDLDIRVSRSFNNNNSWIGDGFLIIDASLTNPYYGLMTYIPGYGTGLTSFEFSDASLKGELLFGAVTYEYEHGSVVPLPAALPLFLSGLVGVGGLALRRKTVTA